MSKNERFLYCFDMIYPTDNRQYPDLNEVERLSHSLRENRTTGTLETDTGCSFLIGKGISRDPHTHSLFYA